MFKCGWETLENMSDADFRKYERAVREGDIDALPDLIKEASRTGTNIYPYLNHIFPPTPEMCDVLENAGLIDMHRYGGDTISTTHEKIRRNKRVVPSLELLLLNQLVTGALEGLNTANSTIIKESAAISATQLVLLRQNPFLSGEINTVNILNDETYQKLQQAAAGQKPPNSHLTRNHRTALEFITTERFYSHTLEFDGLVDFFGLPQTRISLLSSAARTQYLSPISLLGIERTDAIKIKLSVSVIGGRPRLYAVTEHAERVLGNPNVFDFEGI